MFHYIWFFFMHYFSCFKILLFTIYFFFLHLFVYHVLVVRNNYGVNKLDWAYSNWNLQNQKGLFPAPPMISPVPPKFILIPSLPMVKKWVIIFYCTAPPNTPWFTALHPQKQIPSSAPCTPLLPLLSLLPHTHNTTPTRLLPLLPLLSLLPHTQHSTTHVPPSSFFFLGNGLCNPFPFIYLFFF